MTTRAPELAPAQAPQTDRARKAWLWAAIVAAIVLMYVVYWRESWTVGANSDSASTALQAWDVLHGNTLLHGWWMSDVSFYTTEIPQYVILEAIFGLGPAVVHIAAAMTYTLIVVFAALLAKGRARGTEGLVRALLAATVAMSPQMSASLTYLLGPDHTGTMVPVLATWLVIDRVPKTAPGARWYMPAVVAVLIAWIMTADSIVLFAAIAPLVISAAIRAGGAIVRRGERLAGKVYELSLAVGALAGAWVGDQMPRVIAHFGGYTVWHFQTRTVPLSHLGSSAWDTTQAVLMLLGADIFSASSGVELVLIWLHLAGVLAALAGLLIALRRFFSEETLVMPALAIAIMLETGAFLVSIHSTNLDSVRELVPVMPFGAVLAGRMMAAPLLRGLNAARLGTARLGTVRLGTVRLGTARLGTVLIPALAVVAAGYLGSMVYGATRPSVPTVNQSLADWLTEHHLTSGLAGYWEAGSVTLNTGGRIVVSGVKQSGGWVGQYDWETQKSQYDPTLHDPTFVVVSAPPVDPPVKGLPAAAIKTFGKPAGVYHIPGYTIMVWHKNLLVRMSR
jgi:hypothetical protein